MSSRTNLSDPSKNALKPGVSQASASRNELLGVSENVTAKPSNTHVGSVGVTNPGYQAGSPIDPPLTELQTINLKINQKTDESLQSTRRMIGLLEESHEVGAKTMENLHKQGEQLNKVEESLDTMNQDLREAEKNMEQMEKCCGLCVCPWRRRANFEKSTTFQKNFGGSNGNARVETETLRMDQPNVTASYTRLGIQRITNDDREDEMEDNLNAVGGVLSNLKDMATNMGSTIQQQNRQIDGMRDKTIVTDDRVGAANKRANEILKKA